MMNLIVRQVSQAAGWLTGFEDSFDQAIEQLIEQHAAVKKATAEHTKKEEAYLNALNKSRNK